MLIQQPLEVIAQGIDDQLGNGKAYIIKPYGRPMLKITVLHQQGGLISSSDAQKKAWKQPLKTALQSCGLKAVADEVTLKTPVP